MSSAVFSTSAAESRPFVFDGETEGVEHCHPERSGKWAKHISRGVEGSLPFFDSRLASVTPASRLEIRPTPEMASTGIPALDAFTGGLPRGCLTEICGPASSGRTSVMLAALAAATHRGEYCAVIDASDSLDPNSVAASGADLDRFLWVRCNENSSQRLKGTEKVGNEKDGRPLFAEGLEQPNFNFDKRKSRSSERRLEQVLRATDLLLESGGFGLIILDLADLPWEAARRIPLTTWFRFRRAVENKPTILLAAAQQSITGSCSSLLMQLGVPSSQLSVIGASQSSKIPPCDEKPSHAHLFIELKINAELIRSRLDRKPARSITFETKTAWAG